MSREQTNPAGKWRSPVPRSTYRGSTPPEQTVRGGEVTGSRTWAVFLQQRYALGWKCEGAPGVVFLTPTAFSRDEDDMTVWAGGSHHLTLHLKCKLSGGLIGCLSSLVLFQKFFFSSFFFEAYFLNRGLTRGYLQWELHLLIFLPGVMQCMRKIFINVFWRNNSIRNFLLMLYFLNLLSL